MELVAIVANGEIVAPVHAHAVRYHIRPDIAYVPITPAARVPGPAQGPG
ncbi:hypothetical protein AB0J35_58875 [Nonomuraea angiospora]